MILQLSLQDILEGHFLERRRLLRAYSGAVKEGLANSIIITKYKGYKLEFTTDYTNIRKNSVHIGAEEDSDIGYGL